MTARRRFKRTRKVARAFTLSALWGQRKNPVTIVMLLALLGMSGYHINYDSSKGLTVQWTKEQVAGVKAVVDASREVSQAQRRAEFRLWMSEVIRDECRRR